MGFFSSTSFPWVFGVFPLYPRKRCFPNNAVGRKACDLFQEGPAISGSLESPLRQGPPEGPGAIPFFMGQRRAEHRRKVSRNCDLHQKLKGLESEFEVCGHACWIYRRSALAIAGGLPQSSKEHLAKSFRPILRIDSLPAKC